MNSGVVSVCVSRASSLSCGPTADGWARLGLELGRPRTVAEATRQKGAIVIALFTNTPNAVGGHKTSIDQRLSVCPVSPIWRRRTTQPTEETPLTSVPKVQNDDAAAAADDNDNEDDEIGCSISSTAVEACSRWPKSAASSGSGRGYVRAQVCA